MSTQTSTHPNDGKISLKMKPLVTNYRVLTWLCVCPSEVPISWGRKLAYICLITSIFIACVYATLASAAFLIKNLSVDLEESLYSFAQMAGYIAATYLIIVALFLRQEITKLFAGLSRIYAESKHFS